MIVLLKNCLRIRCARLQDDLSTGKRTLVQRIRQVNRDLRGEDAIVDAKRPDSCSIVLKEELKPAFILARTSLRQY